MSKEIYLVTPIKVTNDLPRLGAGVEVLKPSVPMFSEPIEYNYTGAQLKQIMREENVELLGGVRLFPDALNNLPEDYLLAMYMNTRYGLGTDQTMFAPRAGSGYSCSYLALLAYPVLSLMFASLHKRHNLTIDPVRKFEAENFARTLRHINYSWLEATKAFEANPDSADWVVVSKMTITTTLGDQAEVMERYYLNAVNAAPLIAAGATPEDLVEYYETTGMQPT